MSLSGKQLAIGTGAFLGIWAVVIAFEAFGASQGIVPERASLGQLLGKSGRHAFLIWLGIVFVVAVSRQTSKPSR